MAIVANVIHTFPDKTQCNNFCVEKKYCINTKSNLIEIVFSPTDGYGGGRGFGDGYNGYGGGPGG